MATRGQDGPLGVEGVEVDGGVVVGVDGSAAAHQALLFAAREAQLRGVVLTIVSAHDLGVPASGYVGGFGGGFAMDDMRAAVEALVKTAADTVAVELTGPPVHVLARVVQGRPSRVLLDASKDAGMLVVGAHGAGALSRLILGSTSTEVVHAARVPVTVVPHDGLAPA